MEIEKGFFYYMSSLINNAVQSLSLKKSWGIVFNDKPPAYSV